MRCLLELLDEIGAHAARIEKLLELDVGQLLQLGLGVVDAALLANARADLPHDLLDVHRIGSNVEICHGTRFAIRGLTSGHAAAVVPLPAVAGGSRTPALP